MHRARDGRNHFSWRMFHDLSENSEFGGRACMLISLTIKRVLCEEILAHQEECSVQNHPKDWIKLMHHLKSLSLPPPSFQESLDKFF